MPDHPKPTQATVRTYNVGFGDCILLSFTYPAFERHILIDFGSTKYPENAPPRYLAHVAEQIRTDCGGKLNAVVATHRHRDHIRGFERNQSGTGPGDVIHACDPDVVIRGWTEDPEAAEDAEDATVRTRIRSFRAALDAMSDFSRAAVDTVPQLRGALPDARLRRLEFVGEDNIKNLEAVRSLNDMPGRQVYVKYGVSARLTRLLPGVKVRVLGPPSLEQTDTIRDQRSSDADEFWHLQARSARVGSVPDRELFPGAATGEPPADSHWFARRVRELRADSLYEIVTQLDEEMNNTSVILLFESQGKKFLFPGDAQYENWMYALRKPSVRSALQGVNVYKVGHHGSLNATPKTLWSLFGHRGPAGTQDRLQTLNSTLSGFHGEESNDSEVPRIPLVEALEEDSDYTTTELQSVEEPHVLRIPLP